MRIKHLGFLATFAAFLIVSPTACSLGNLLEGNDPDQGLTLLPGEVTTYTGAVGVYRSTIQTLARALSLVSEDVGVITDELTASNRQNVDARTSSSLGNGIGSASYAALQSTRVRAAQSVELLQKYGTEEDYPKLGHAYAMEAYAITLLAELFCSGVPLTEVPLDGHMQYTRGFSTTELLERAVVLFDSAHSYGKDSLPIATFASVGKGRALLGLGRYADAAAAVAQVPAGANYTVQFIAQTYGIPFWTGAVGAATNNAVLSSEGTNGIRWTADSAKLQDPRVALSVRDSVRYTPTIRQLKYVGGTVNVVVADAIAAQLIRAEAELQPAAAPSGPWLATINAARATLATPLLPPLTDPGTPAGRIDLLFRERAFWFYLNGSRLGDLRRLVRQYDRLPAQVYPTGVYLGNSLSIGSYGNEYVFTLPPSEEDLNPVYDGCIDKLP